MNTTQKHYLLAAKALIKEGATPALIFQGLKQTLERRGHSKLYPNLLRSLLRSLEEDRTTSAPVLVVSKEEDAKRFMDKASLDSTRVVVDESIVGGHILTKDWKREDNSYKTKLLTWYRRSVK